MGKRALALILGLLAAIRAAAGEPASGLRAFRAGRIATLDGPPVAPGLPGVHRGGDPERRGLPGGWGVGPVQRAGPLREMGPLRGSRVGDGPGPALERGDKHPERALAVLAGRREVAPGCAERLGTLEAAEAPRDFLVDLDHAESPLGDVGGVIPISE